MYPGDGIGCEVADAARSVLEVARRQSSPRFDIDWIDVDWGVERFRRCGELVPDDFLGQLRELDAIWLGAIGWPETLPDSITLVPLIRIRQSFDLFACVRPVKLWPGIQSPLRNKRIGDIDLVVVRENSEGEYLNIGGRHHAGTAREVAIQTCLHTRRGVERIVRFGFELARTRRNKLTMITKSNALTHAMSLWDDVLQDVRPEFADVDCDKQHVDAAAMNLVRRPEKFDVIVASNLFGDILSDLTAMVCGGLGLAPSANLRPDRQLPSLFEPVHGSAPDIAGKQVANPIAMILSGAMMLDWLGQTNTAKRIELAVMTALADGCRTHDLGGSLSTEQMATEISVAIHGNKQFK